MLPGPGTPVPVYLSYSYSSYCLTRYVIITPLGVYMHSARPTTEQIHSLLLGLFDMDGSINFSVDCTGHIEQILAYKTNILWN